MAEHYGVVPKKFTKEWWPYFWMYYKWQTISVIFVICLILLTVFQCVTRPKYDLTLTYAGNKVFSEEQSSLIESDLSEIIDDVDGNGASSVFFQCLSFTDTVGSEEYDAAMQSKLDLGMYDEGALLYIVDAKRLQSMMSSSYYSEIYIPVNEWLSEEVSEELIYSMEGVPYAVSLQNSEYLRSNNFITEDMFLLVRRDNSGETEESAEYEQALKIANMLVK